MFLKSISGYRYSQEKELLIELSFVGEVGEIKLKLPEEASAKVLALVADALVQQTKFLASTFTKELVNVSVPALEHKSNDD